MLRPCRVYRHAGDAFYFIEFPSDLLRVDRIEFFEFSPIPFSEFASHFFEHGPRICPVGFHQGRIARRPLEILHNRLGQRARAECFAVIHPVIGRLEMQNAMLRDLFRKIGRAFESELQIAFLCTVGLQMYAGHKPVIGALEKLLRVIDARKGPLEIQSRQNHIAPNLEARPAHPVHIVGLRYHESFRPLLPCSGAVLARHRCLAVFVDDIGDLTGFRASRDPRTAFLAKRQFP